MPVKMIILIQLIMLFPQSLPSQEVDARRDRRPEENPLFEDLKFQRGFNLSFPGSKQGRKVAAVLRAESEIREPRWRLCQWGTRHSLADAKPDRSTNSLTFENIAKRVCVVDSGSTKGDLVLDIRGSREYGSDVRKRGDPWPHLLVEQDVLVRYPLAELSTIDLRLDLRLLSATNNVPESFDPQLHSAQFQLFFVVKNVKRGSPDYGEFFWFGTPFYDWRHDFPRSHMAKDGGKDDASGKFIYSIAGNEILTRPLRDKRWVSVDKNLLPFMLAGLKEAVKRGYLKSDDPRQYAVVNMNLGWELPGNFDAAIQIRNLDVSVTLLDD